MNGYMNQTLELTQGMKELMSHLLEYFKYRKKKSK